MVGSFDTAILDAYKEDILERFNYKPQFLDPNNVIRFRSEDKPRTTLDLETRAFIYVKKGFPLMLESPTGRGKTTLVKNLALKMGKPIFIQNGGDREFTKDDALYESTLLKDNILTHPGKLTRAALFNGIYFFDELSNIRSGAFTDFNTLLQGDPQDFLTHRGYVTIDFKKHLKRGFRFIGAGNFCYQKPDFTQASLQRFVWMEMPVLSREIKDEMFKQKMRGTSTLSADDLTADCINSTYEKLFTLELNDEELDSLSHMLRNIEDRLENETDLGKEGEIHLNPYCTDRAGACFSPFMTPDDYANILEETVVLPVAGRNWYESPPGERDHIEQLKSIVRQEVSIHKNLFRGPFHGE